MIVMLVNDKVYLKFFLNIQIPLQTIFKYHHRIT